MDALKEEVFEKTNKADVPIHVNSTVIVILIIFQKNSIFSPLNLNR
jgi:hypothetical protein